MHSETPATPLPDVASVDAHARAYVQARLAKEALDAIITHDVDATPEAAAVRDLEAQLAAAQARLLAASQNHPQRPSLVAAAAQEEAAKKALLQAWPGQVAALGKSIPLPQGTVQIRVTEGVEVRDTQALAEDLLKKGLFAAAVSSMKVDAKLLRPLVEKTGLQGAVATDAYTIAFTPKRGA